MGIGRLPAGAAREVGAHDVIVGEDMGKTQLFGKLRIVLDHGRIATDFRLGKNYADTHG